jgi:hypothetical protein
MTHNTGMYNPTLATYHYHSGPLGISRYRPHEWVAKLPSHRPFLDGL